MTRLPDYVRRPLRLFLWVFLGTFSLALTGWLQQVTEWAATGGQEFPDLTLLGRAAVAGLVAGGAAVVAFVVNALEDKTKMPAVLKAPASDGANPEPEGGHTDPATLLVIVVVAAAVAVLVHVLL